MGHKRVADCFVRRRSGPPLVTWSTGILSLGVVLGIGLHQFLTARRADDARTTTPRDPVRRRPIGDRRVNSIALGPGPPDADGLVISRVLTPDGDMRDEDVSLWSRLSQMHHSRTCHEHLPPKRSDDFTDSLLMDTLPTVSSRVKGEERSRPIRCAINQRHAKSRQNLVQSLNGKLNWPCEEENRLSKDFSQT